MRKPKIFIGSSDKSKPVANHLAACLEESGIYCRVWSDGVFTIGHSFLTDLLHATAINDFAVLIYGLDDSIGGEEDDQWFPRDNVVFESGLFTGALGPDRCFLVAAKGTRIPTNLAGITVAFYDSERFDQEGKPAVREAATRIQEQIQDIRPRLVTGVSREMVDFLYGQTGLTEAFHRRSDARSGILRDISQATRNVDMYARVYISEVMRHKGELVDALKDAAIASAGGEIRVSQTNTHYQNEDMVRHAWQIEKTDDPARFTKLEDYRKHVKEGTDYLDAARRGLERALAGIPRASRRGVRFIRRHLESPITYSLIVIDDQIVWVSFYWRTSGDMPYGTFAPTMRLSTEGLDDSWAHRLVDQAKDVDRGSSSLGSDLGTV